MHCESLKELLNGKLLFNLPMTTWHEPNIYLVLHTSIMKKLMQFVSIHGLVHKGRITKLI